MLYIHICYQFRTNMVAMWYESAINVVRIWYQSGTNLVPIWYQSVTNPQASSGFLRLPQASSGSLSEKWLKKNWPELLDWQSTGTIWKDDIRWHLRRTARVPAEYWQSIGRVLAECWQSTGRVLAEYRQSTGRVLAEYRQSTGRVWAQAIVKGQLSVTSPEDAWCNARCDSEAEGSARAD